MSVRDQMNQNSTVMLAALLVVLLLSLGFLTWWFVPREEPEKQQMAWFYDLNTKELFTAPASELGPIETESGPFNGMPAGVRANVYCCGPLVKDAQTFIGYLEAPTEGVPEAMRPPMVELSEDSEENDVLVRRLDEEQWHVIGSAEGQAMMQELHTRCGEGQQVTYATPPPE